MPIELAQRTADLDRGHDAIVKKDESAFAIDISFGDAAYRLTKINPVGFAPAGDRREASEAAIYSELRF